MIIGSLEPIFQVSGVLGFWGYNEQACQRFHLNKRVIGSTINIKVKKEEDYLV